MDEANQGHSKERQQRSRGLIYAIYVPWIERALPILHFHAFFLWRCEFSEEAVWHLGYSRWLMHLVAQSFIRRRESRVVDMVTCKKQWFMICESTLKRQSVVYYKMLLYLPFFLGFNEDSAQGGRFETNTGSNTRNYYTTQICTKWTRNH